VGDVGRGLDCWAIEELCKTLVHNTRIKHLILSRNLIGDVGLKSITWLLTHNSTITNIDLRFNDLTAEVYAPSSICDNDDWSPVGADVGWLLLE